MKKIIPLAVSINSNYLSFFLENNLTMKDYKELNISPETKIDIITENAICTLYAICNTNFSNPKLFLTIETDKSFVTLPVQNKQKGFKNTLKKYFKGVM